jgi:hypothetical protein
LEISNHTLNELTFKNLTDIETDVTIGSNVLGLAQLAKIKIAEYNFQPFVAGYLPTPIPFPIIVLPKLGVYIGIDPTNVNPLSVRVKQNASSEVGLIYNGVWSTTSDFSNSFDFSNPVVNSDIELKAHAGPDLEFMLSAKGRLCELCNAPLKATREFTHAWTFSCEVCKSVEIHGKAQVGGTIGAGEVEKS